MESPICAPFQWVQFPVSQTAPDRTCHQCSVQSFCLETPWARGGQVSARHLSTQRTALEPEDPPSLQFSGFQCEPFNTSSSQAMVQPQSVESVEHVSARLNLHSALAKSALQRVHHQQRDVLLSVQFHSLPVHVHQSQKCRSWTVPQIALLMDKAVHRQFFMDKLSHLRMGECQYKAAVSLIPHHSDPWTAVKSTSSEVALAWITAMPRYSSVSVLE